jgi:homoserine O-acetyltransferase/O-succinyltransferase
MEVPNKLSMSKSHWERLANQLTEHVPSQPENPYSALVDGQSFAIIPEFELESEVVLRDVPVAYKTWGKLNAERSNVLIICHALSGSADVEDWYSRAVLVNGRWGPLIGPGKAFDTSKFFIFCGNALGSPYGSASPVTINPDTQEPYGPEFPLVTIRDDVKYVRTIVV